MESAAPVKKTISLVRLNRSLDVSLAAGVMGTLWYTVCSAQPIFNVFFTNQLHGTSSELGLLVAIIQIAGVFQLFSVFFYARLADRKVFFCVLHMIHRLFGFVLAWTAWRAYSSGVDAGQIRIIFVSIGASWLLMSVSSSGWWAWMADLIPERIRAAFFGKRSGVSNAANMVWYLGITTALDLVTGRERFIVYMIVFLVAAVLGVVDIALHFAIPEPEAPRRRPEESLASSFFEPLRDKNFLYYSLAIGISVFAINVAGPFIPTYITSPRSLGAPYTWLGITFVISQLTWMAVSGFWGTVMDRFGRKAVVILGNLFVLSWAGYIFLNQRNIVYLLPLISLAGGVLAPAYWDGMNQMMLSLAPERNRIAYVSWYMAIVGVVSASASYAGGWLDDALADLSFRITEQWSLNGFHVVLLISLGLTAVGIFLLTRIKESRSKEFGYVVSQIARPAVFRTFVNIGVLASPSDPERVAKALRAIDGYANDLALEDIIVRLSDPDAQVRKESAAALGRIGSPEAVDALLRDLEDESSAARAESALSLGRIGEGRALSALLKHLSQGPEELQEACATALGDIGGDEAYRALVELFRPASPDRAARSERVIASGAEAVSKLGAIETAGVILRRMLLTEIPVFRKQLAIALGNLIGTPGDFYTYVTGRPSERQEAVRQLFVRTRTRLSGLLKRKRGEAEKRDGALAVQETALVDFGRVQKHCEEREYAAAFEILRRSVLPALTPDSAPPPDRNGKQGLREGFVEDAAALLRGIEGGDLSELVLLLGVYSLSQR